MNMNLQPSRSRFTQVPHAIRKGIRQLLGAVLTMTASLGWAGPLDAGQLNLPPTALDPLPLAAASSATIPAAPSVYRVPLYKSTVVALAQGVRRVSVGNPGIADILVLRDTEVYVVGKAVGTTNVVAWDSSNRLFASFDVEVTHDLDTLKTKLHQLLPGEKIEVHSAQEQLILAGQVSSLVRMDAARQLAQSFLPDCVRAESSAPVDPGVSGKFPSSPDPSCKKGAIVNLMQVGGAQQVMLKVTVAEMARSVVRRLDSNFNLMRFGGSYTGGAVSGGASFPDALDPSGLIAPIFAGGNSPIGPATDLFSPTTPAIDATGLFLGYMNGKHYLQAVMDISKRQGLAKVLSEPTLTTLTGQEAQFLSGGEFPIPVPQGNGGSTTIEFKDFGVGLKFLPLVLDSGRINLTLNVSVSEISADNVVAIRAANTTSSFVIPSLTKRSASSSVELSDGQTIGIAGLINDNVRDFVSKLPGLGDIPLLGALFRSQEYVSGQSELVIFVTPHLARPIAPERIRLPTENFVPPGELEFYLMGRIESADSPARTSQFTAPRNMPQGRFGHEVNGLATTAEKTP